MADVDDDRPQHPIGDLRYGSVTRNDDPFRLGRVKVRVPGIFEPESRWCFPMGTLGGGDTKRGWFAVPKVGSEVCILCNSGDPDFPFYISGHWGRPGGVSDAPSFATDPTVSDADAHLLMGLETDRFLFFFDDRPGKQSFILKDKVSGDGISYDSTLRAMELKSTTAIVIKATGAVEIDATAVTIAGRPVVPGSGPI